MTILAVLLFLAVFAVAGAHALWATGSAFPAKNRKQLSKAVVGFRGPDRMPQAWLIVVVAFALLFSAFWALVLGGLISMPAWLAVSVGVLVALVYLARGIAGYMRFWQMMTPKKPFRRLDRIYYSPFSLLAGLAFVILIIGNFS